jgi:hypothetical protein
MKGADLHIFAPCSKISTPLSASNLTVGIPLVNGCPVVQWPANMSDLKPANRSSWFSKWSVLGFIALAAVPLGFALYTGQVWEDFFITFRHSQNLVDGQGLVYNPGERVHGFTSPIGVLLPALCDALTGHHSYFRALWLFRVIGAAAFAGGGLLVWRILSNGPYPHARWFGILLYAFDAKGVANSVNGMETAFMLLLVAWHIELLRTGLLRHWFALGLCWAGLMWVRPDSCIYIAVLSVAGLAFSQEPRKALFISLLKSAGVCTVLYLPWFTWAWAYYGSPIPQTVLAKMTVESASTGEFGTSLWSLVSRYVLAMGRVFQPAYFSAGDTSWHWGLLTLTSLMGGFCVVYWAVPNRDRVGRAASLSFALLCLYFTTMALVYPWYLPPAALLGAIVISQGTFAVAGAVRWQPRLVQVVVGAGLGLLVAERVYMFAMTCRDAAFSQRVVELGNRARIGMWLGDQINQGAGNRICLEPIGYIGYFSGAKVVDWPGLVTPEVVRLRREQGIGFVGLPEALRPDWLILRPRELKMMEQRPFFREHYVLVKKFDVSQEIEQQDFLPGQDGMLFDSVFLAYRLKTE